MKNEINKDFYCSAGYLRGCVKSGYNFDHCSLNCICRHRKHPTPEQYKEEYGGEYPDDGAVYLLWKCFPKIEFEWIVTSYKNAKVVNEEEETYPMVCACTPFGKPDDTWRPE
jgi:hypothetical protein